jgi:uncharacterized cupin superfamily protein
VPRPNVFSGELEWSADDPPGYRSGMGRVGAQAGGEALAVKVFELPPGESVCPYHYEYEEEWLVVLTGTVLLRTPAGEELLETGAVVCFSSGPSGAHKTTNTADEPARLLMFSSAREPAVAVYPDSDKIGVWPGNPDDKVMLHRADGAVDYFDGEA